MPLPVAAGLELGNLEIPSNPNHSMVLIKKKGAWSSTNSFGLSGTPWYPNIFLCRVYFWREHCNHHSMIWKCAKWRRQCLHWDTAHLGRWSRDRHSSSLGKACPGNPVGSPLVRCNPTSTTGCAALCTGVSEVSGYSTNIPVKQIVADSNQAVTCGFDVLACSNPAHFSLVFCTVSSACF